MQLDDELLKIFLAEIASYQAAHDPKHPLDSLTKAKRNAALVKICQKIKEAVNAG